MNKKSIKYLHHTTEGISVEIYLDPSSNAYTLYKEKKMEELGKLLDLCIVSDGKWRK